MFKHSQFILWRPEWNERLNKWDKIPVNPATGRGCNAHDPAAWVDYESIKALATYHNLGIAFVFTEADPYFFIDVDDALEPDGQWSQMAQYVCGQFAGCAIEVSHSKRGLHIFGSAAVGPHRCKPTEDIGVDVYTGGRFAALTFDGWTGDPNVGGQEALERLIALYFVADAGSGTPAEWTDGPVPEWSGPEDDTELIGRMMGSKSAASIFGNKASIPDLWLADADKLGQFFPHDQGLQPFDHSEADASLCQHLAFWTGKDCERMDRVFRMSGLYRDKWEDREGYRRTTILKAAGSCQNVYSRGGPTAADPALGASADPAAIGGAGMQFMPVTQQVEHFKTCVYIRDLHRAFVPDGALLKPEQFKASYGGYTFAMDNINNKVTRNAWEVFTESQGYKFPKVNITCFRPEIVPGAVFEEGGESMVNTYVPINTASKQGDATPFVEHIAKLLPSKIDQTIVISYMAACVQYPGVKFQWCPLLQGCEGNGKTFLVNCLAESIGWKYSHMPNAADLSNTFNFWILNKLFIGVEEVFTQDKQEVHETLKRLITNPKIEVHGKGTNQITGDNRANFFMCSNYKDAIRKSNLDRRFSIFFTAQQRAGDLARDGMGGKYFPNLYNWARAGGYAIVNNYLRTYKIPDALNPAGECHRAPITTSTDEALAVSRGLIDQEIVEAIESESFGFANGWVSSMALRKLLLNRRISNRRMYEIVESLGYETHPGLINGRVTSIITIEGGKPRLYIRTDNPDRALETSSEIVKAYLLAQGVK